MKSVRFTRRTRGWALCALCVACLVASSSSSADAVPAKFSKTTYTFKRVGELKLQADVYRHDDAVKRHVIVWLHGGALIMGSRTGVPQQLRGLAEEAGFVLVSLDYRLGPVTKLPEIIADLRDGIRWIRDSGPKLFNADPSRTVVAGASAGGYLALMSGSLEKPPTAIVSYWGFGDIDGDWTTKPSTAFKKSKLISKEDAWAGIGENAITSTNKESGRGRSTYFVYLKQTGRWINEVGGFDPTTDREKITPYCPVRNVTAAFPPTLFLHGTADKDVPVEQSLSMASELKRNEVPHEVITIEGGGHSLWGGDRALIEKAFERSMEYIREHLAEP